MDTRSTMTSIARTSGDGAVVTKVSTALARVFVVAIIVALALALVRIPFQRKMRLKVGVTTHPRLRLFLSRRLLRCPC